LSSKLVDHSVPLIRAIVVHPDRGSDNSRHAIDRLEEAVGLARALDLDVRAEEIVRVRSITPATLFGSGKVEELEALVLAAEAEAVEQVRAAAKESEAIGTLGQSRPSVKEMFEEVFAEPDWRLVEQRREVGV